MCGQLVFVIVIIIFMIDFGQIFYFKMEEGVDVVTVDVATDSKKCVIVSVQNKTVSLFHTTLSICAC